MDINTIVTRPYDNHHCLWPRRDWNKGYAKGIRSHWYFIVKIPRKTLHARIHEGITCIPVPPGQICRRVFEKIMSLDSYGLLSEEDPLESRLEMLASMFDGLYDPTADAIREQSKIVRRFYNRPP